MQETVLNQMDKPIQVDGFIMEVEEVMLNMSLLEEIQMRQANGIKGDGSGLLYSEGF